MDSFHRWRRTWKWIWTWIPQTLATTTANANITDWLLIMCCAWIVARQLATEKRRGHSVPGDNVNDTNAFDQQLAIKVLVIYSSTYFVLFFSWNIVIQFLVNSKWIVVPNHSARGVLCVGLQPVRFSLRSSFGCYIPRKRSPVLPYLIQH